MGKEIGGGLTCVNLALEVNLLPLGVATCRDVNSGHVEAQVALTYTLDVADQVWVLFCLLLVPHDYCIVGMLRWRGQRGREIITPSKTEHIV